MNKSIAAIGVAKQVNQSTLATAPTFWHGVTSGAMASAEVTDEVAEVTTGLAAPALAYRSQVALPTGFQTMGFARVIGLYLLGILGSVTTTGASAPYTHVFKLGDTLPWLTFFSKLDTWMQVNGASKIDSLTIKWDGPKPISITVVAQGCTFSKPVSITVPVTNELLGTFFTPVGGTFQVDVDGSTLAAYPVLGGEITLKRAQTVDYYAHDITPGGIFEAALEASVQLTVRAPSLADWNTILTGTPAGTTVSGNPVIGSFSNSFKAGADTLTIAGGRVMFNSKAPEADPKGGPVELVLEGTMLTVDSTTSPVTATLVNSVEAY